MKEKNEPANIRMKGPASRMAEEPTFGYSDRSLLTFPSQDFIGNSPYWLSYKCYGVSSENLIWINWYLLST